MKAVLLGAGYGTRLARDLENDTSGLYSHLIGVPKPLLPIGKYPLVTHWLRMLRDVPEVDQVYIVTNASNHVSFEKWAADWPEVKLVCDGTCSNETRIGAVACMDLAAKAFNMTDDMLVIAGDTLFYDDFRLNDILARYAEFKVKDAEGSMVTYVTCTDAEVHKYGILETDDRMRVKGFLEKPQPHETASRKECPCFYLFSRSCLPLLQSFLDERKDGPLKARDATGNFLAYLYQRKPVYATEISGRFDVGGLPSYITCHEHFLRKHNAQS